MLDKTRVRVLDIVRGTTVDGPGFRTSIYLAGCRHQCPGCHNPQSWDFNAGEEMSLGEILNIVEEEDFDVTFSGGDPLYHKKALMQLSDAIHALGHTVWIYTGFTWEEIISDPELLSAVRKADVIVDGRFEESLKDRDLLFKGSSNQRLIDVSKSLASGQIVGWSR